MAIALGATHTIDPVEGGELATKVRAIIPAGVQYALDTTGKNSVINAAVGALAHQATLGILAAPASAEDALLSFDVISLLGLGYRIKGITEGDVDPARFIPRMVELFMDGKFPFDRLIANYPLSDINRAIDEQYQGVCIKPVLIP
jgi:aryl-alcohol dehydrogenase